MLQLFDPMYWFTLESPVVNSAFGYAVFAIFVAVFIGGFIVKLVLQRKAKDAYDAEVRLRTSRMMLVMGLIGTILFFFSYEKAYLIGARFWYLFWGAGLLYWVFRIIWFAKKEVPQSRVERQQKIEREKYLPTSKKK